MAKKKNGNGNVPLSAGARLFAYLRDSGGVEQEKSVPDQRAALLAFAEERAWAIVGWYVDEARSGATVDNRPQFLEMVAACKSQSHPVDGVLVWALSRFARNEWEAQLYSAELYLRGVRVVSATETIPEEFATVYVAMLRWKDAKYLDDLSRAVQRGLRSNVNAGFAQGGRPPVGYMAVPESRGNHRDGQPRSVSRWVPDPDIAPRVQLAFRMKADGYPVSEIHAATLLHGTRGGYSRMFERKTYIGTLTLGEHEVPGAIEPLIDMDTWTAVQNRLAGNRIPPRCVTSPYLLSGLLFCGYCNRRMTAHVYDDTPRRPRVYRYYQCSSHVHHLGERCAQPTLIMDDIDAAILSQIKSDWLTPDAIDKAAARVLARYEDERGADEAKAIDGEVIRLEREIGRLVRLSATAPDAAQDEISRELAGRSVELTGLRARRAAIAADPARAQHTAAETRAKLERVAAELYQDDVLTARRAIASLVEKIVATDDNLQIVYRQI